MTQKASRRVTVGKRIKDADDKIEDLYNLVRRKGYNPGAVNVGIGGGSPAGHVVQPGSYLRTEGDTMIGPIAFFPQLSQIIGGVISVDTANQYTSYIVLAVQSGFVDDLDTISGATFSGQQLFLQVVAAETITIKHLTGNIRCGTGADIILTGQTVIQIGRAHV